MKKILIFSLFLLGGLTFACDSDDDNSNPTLELTAQEKADLLFLREEEKLARDVYLYAYEAYGLMIFDNISGSEQRHMDYVFEILEKYGLVDPAKNEVGVFNDPDLQLLYDQLTAKVDLSLLDALEVGATIEDLDINDLAVNITNTDKSDLKSLYETLKCGSENHMRAFYGQIENRDGTYVPQYITQELLDNILAGSSGHCG